MTKVTPGRLTDQHDPGAVDPRRAFPGADRAWPEGSTLAYGRFYRALLGVCLRNLPHGGLRVRDLRCLHEMKTDRTSAFTSPQDQNELARMSQGAVVSDKAIDLAIWFGISVVVPAIVPYLVLLLLCKTTNEKKEPRLRYALMPIQGYKDGQLLWLSLTMSLIGLSEVITAERHVHDWKNLLLLVCLVVSLVISALLLGKATGKVGPLPTKKEDRDLLVMYASFWLTAFAAFVCLGVHAQLLGI